MTARLTTLILLMTSASSIAWRCMVQPRFHATHRSGTLRRFLFVTAMPLIVACGGNDVTAPVPTVAGTVVVSGTNTPVAGAEVSIGGTTVTTSSDGRFVLTDLTAGQATLRCTAPGFESFEASVTVSSGGMTRDMAIGLARVALIEFGDFALYVPTSVSTVRGILVALGGPNTRGFASGVAFGAPLPAVEASLQELGKQFRVLAESHGIAVLGTSRTALPNGTESDQILLAALREAAGKSSRPELSNAPLLLYGLSGGGPAASGFTARNPDRVAGLFLKVPSRVETLTSGNVLGVPTFTVLAEVDAFVNNAALETAFRANRRAGALWALALEPGVQHHSLTPAQRELTTSWMSTILNLRLTTASQPLRAIVESSGWLGDPATGRLASWTSYPADRAAASWFPSQGIAEFWRTFAKLTAP